MLCQRRDLLHASDYPFPLSNTPSAQLSRRLCACLGYPPSRLFPIRVCPADFRNREAWTSSGLGCDRYIKVTASRPPAAATTWVSYPTLLLCSTPLHQHKMRRCRLTATQSQHFIGAARYRRPRHGCYIRKTERSVLSLYTLPSPGISQKRVPRETYKVCGKKSAARREKIEYAGSFLST